MITLFRVGDAAAGEKRSPQEGCAAAVLLQYAKIDVHSQRLPGFVAELADDALQLGRVGDLEDQLFPSLLLLRQTIKAQVKGPVKQLRQPPRKLRILRDDANLPGIEGIAVEQDPVCLRPGTADPLHRDPAQFTFHLIGKGLHTSSYFSTRFLAERVPSSTTRMVRWR